MASVKITSLVIRTLAKPIATQIKEQAKNHGRFRDFCIGIAQSLHRNEVRMRTNVLGENLKSDKIRPLNDRKAIDNGANFLSESFLFLVAVGLILGETIRGRRATANRRDTVDDRLDELAQRLDDLSAKHDEEKHDLMQQLKEQADTVADLSAVTNRVLDIGLGNPDWRLSLTRANNSKTSTDTIKSTSPS